MRKETMMSDIEVMEQTNGSRKRKIERSNEQINKLVSTLSLPSGIIIKATELLENFPSNLSETEEEETELLWFACFLFIASIEERSLPYGAADPQIALGNLPPASLTVSDLLKAVDLNMLQFFKLLRTTKDRLPLSAKVQDSISQLELKYLIVCPLFNKFEKIFSEIFLKDESFTQAEMTFNSDSEGYQFRRTFCWSLFVYAKASILRGSQQLVLTFHLLIACIEYVLRTTPAFQLRPPFDGLKMESGELDSGVLLEELCSRYSAASEEVIALQENLLNPLLNTLTDEGNTVSCETLQKTYMERYHQFGDIDELGFLRNESHLVVKTSNTVVVNNNNNNNGTMTSNGSNGSGVNGSTNGHGQSSASSSPGVMGPPMTPVRSAMVTVQSLRNLLNTAEDKPGPALLNYFQNCSKQPDPAINAMLDCLRDKFCSQSVESGMPESVAQHRFQLATRLYYRVLESLLKLEEKRLSQQDFSKLLHNMTFHRCLLACAVEIIIMTYGSSWTPVSPYRPSLAISTDDNLRFPWILSAFEIHAYDFVKVLESFVKAEAKLAGEVVKHLRNIENRIVESMAWESNSPLFSSLASSEAPPCSHDSPVGVGEASGVNLYLSPMPPPRPGQSTAHRNASLLPPLSPANHNRGSSSPRQQTGTRRSQSLNLFFNKVCKLAHLRLQKMCSLLDIPRDLQHRIWKCIEYCISQKTELLRDRHLDQVIMCSIFAVCKISDLDVKFKDIVNVYKQMPHGSREVYKSVVISTTGATESIIMFYNLIFMHALKNFLMQFAAARPNSLTLSPVPRSQNLTASPVYPLPGRTNFFVSQLKQSPSQFRAPPSSPGQMTPRTRRLYSFGDSIGSAEKLRTINDSMRAISSSPSPGGQPWGKRLKFDLEASACSSSAAGDNTEQPAESDEAPDMIVVRRVASTSSSAAAATSTATTSSSTTNRPSARRSFTFSQAESPKKQ